MCVDYIVVNYFVLVIIKVMKNFGHSVTMDLECLRKAAYSSGIMYIWAIPPFFDPNTLSELFFCDF